MKAGWRTTEFWISVLTTVASLVGGLSGSLPPRWGLAASTLAGAAYTVSRGIAKHGK